MSIKIAGPWTAEEVEYLIECVGSCDTPQDAYEKVQKRFGHRTPNSYQKKLHSMGLKISTIRAGELSVDEEVDLKNKLEKAKVVDQRKKKDLELFRKRKTVIELIVDTIREEVQSLPAPKKVEPIKFVNKRSEEDLVFPISDVQVGELIDPADVAGLGEYSFKIFEQRMEVWKKYAIEVIATKLNTKNISKIHVPFIGDIVEGMEIFASQPFHLDGGLIKQAVQGAHIFATALAEISATFPGIPIKSINVGGNHGRIGRKGQTPYKDNWDRVVGYFIQAYLQNYKNIEVTVPETWFHVEYIQGWTFHFSHGDDINSWMGIPVYGMQRAHARETMMLDQPIHYYQIGHHHVLSQLQNGYGEVLCNGNWVGANEFVAKQIKASSRPCQIMYSVNKNHGVSDRYICYFEGRKEFEKRKDQFMNHANWKVQAIANKKP